MTHKNSFESIAIDRNREEESKIAIFCKLFYVSSSKQIRILTEVTTQYVCTYMEITRRYERDCFHIRFPYLR